MKQFTATGVDNSAAVFTLWDSTVDEGLRRLVERKGEGLANYMVTVSDTVRGSSSLTNSVIVTGADILAAFGNETARG